MSEWILTGTVKLSGVDFFVEAETEEEALRKAAAGEWSRYETDCAETEGWSVQPKTIRPNE